MELTGSYTCPRCGATSHNPNDERHRYCGACHRYEHDLCSSCATDIPAGSTLCDRCAARGLLT